MTKKLSALLLAMALVFSLAACSGGGQPSTSPTPSESTPVAEGKFTPGTYTGEGQGYAGPIKVEVTLSADRIEKVVVTEPTRPY